MHPKDADGMANSVDPDQTAPRPVWSGSILFAQACLSENLGSLRYFIEWSNWSTYMYWKVWKYFEFFFQNPGKSNFQAFEGQKDWGLDLFLSLQYFS